MSSILRTLLLLAGITGLAAVVYFLSRPESRSFIEQLAEMDSDDLTPEEQSMLLAELKSML
jgi:hypothetical protein